ALRPRGADAMARLGVRHGEGRAQGCCLASFVSIAIHPSSGRTDVISASHKCFVWRRTKDRNTGTRPMPRVLVSDKLSPSAIQIFKEHGVDVDYLPDLGKDKDKLLEVIGDYDGLAIRSATKVTEKLINAAGRLKVIGRAGIGVDNVDIPAASRR